MDYTFGQTAKAWISLIGGLGTVLVPTITTVSNTLPEPWPAVIGAIIALLTTFGVFKVPNKQSGSVSYGDNSGSPWPKD